MKAAASRRTPKALRAPPSLRGHDRAGSVRRVVENLDVEPAWIAEATHAVDEARSDPRLVVQRQLDRERRPTVRRGRVDERQRPAEQANQMEPVQGIDREKQKRGVINDEQRDRRQVHER